MQTNFFVKVFLRFVWEVYAFRIAVFLMPATAVTKFILCLSVSL